MAILSISSRISRGYIGNTAAGFALRTLGHDVWEVPTVVVSHDLGWVQEFARKVVLMER